MDYLNPGSFLMNPQMDFRVNPLAGAVAGMGMGASQNLLDRSYRDSDLSYQDQLLKYQMAQAQAPAQQEEYQQRYNAANTQNQMYNTGLQQQAAQSDLNTKIDTNTTTQSKNAASRQLDAGEELVRISSELDKNPIDFAKDPEGSQKRWKDISDRLAQYGAKMPPLPSPDAVAELHAKAESFENSRDQLQKLAQIRAEGENRLATTKMTTDTQRDIAAQENAARLAIASKAPGQAAEEAKRKVLAGVAGPNDYAVIAVETAEKLGSGIMNSTFMKLQGIATQDPRKAAEAARALIDGLTPQAGPQAPVRAPSPSPAPSGGRVPAASLSARVGTKGETVQLDDGRTAVWDDQRHGWKIQK